MTSFSKNNSNEQTLTPCKTPSKSGDLRESQPRSSISPHLESIKPIETEVSSSNQSIAALAIESGLSPTEFIRRSRQFISSAACGRSKIRKRCMGNPDRMAWEAITRNQRRQGYLHAAEVKLWCDLGWVDIVQSTCGRVTKKGRDWLQQQGQIIPNTQHPNNRQ